MSLRDFIERQKMWVRFHLWEDENRDRFLSQNPIRQIAELADLFSESSLSRPVWDSHSIKGIMRLNQKLKFIKGEK